MSPDDCLSALPAGLRGDLLIAYQEIARNYRERRWEPSELNGGKLCEAAYSVLRGFVDGTMPSRAKKPPNMVDACRTLEAADASKFPRSVRIQIPRVLLSLYEIRNNRGVGHVGGDVNPNAMDARFVLEASKWVMAEVVRVFHSVETREAEEVVDRLIERTVPTVWKAGEKLRVLTEGLSKKQQTLLLLYSGGGAVDQRHLVDWVEASNPSAYRRDVLRALHRERLIEYDTTTGLVSLSPKGTQLVEDSLPLQ